MQNQLLAYAALSILFLGCGGGPGDQVELAPIAGVVHLEGEPVKNAVITFYPDSGPTGVGIGNEQGEFKIKTNGENGAPIGKCKVTVVASGGGSGEIPPADGNELALAENASLNVKYANKETTDLIVDVTAEGKSDLKLDLDKQ